MREKEEGLEKIEIEAGKERVIERKAEKERGGMLWTINLGSGREMVIMVIVIAAHCRVLVCWVTSPARHCKNNKPSNNYFYSFNDKYLTRSAFSVLLYTSLILVETKKY